MKNLKKKISKFFKGLFIAIVVFIAIINAIYVFRKNLDNTHILSIGGVLFYINKTDAMNPTITKSDLLIIKKSEVYGENDLILFKQNGEFKIRKVVNNPQNNHKNYFAVKGDYNLYIEPYEVQEEQIKGKVIKTIKNMGFLLKIIQSKTLLMFNTGILILIIYYRIKLRKRIRKIKNIKNKNLST